jgi:hypothetical protein
MCFKRTIIKLKQCLARYDSNGTETINYFIFIRCTLCRNWTKVKRRNVRRPLGNRMDSLVSVEFVAYIYAEEIVNSMVNVLADDEQFVSNCYHWWHWISLATSFWWCRWRQRHLPGPPMIADDRLGLVRHSVRTKWSGRQRTEYRCCKLYDHQ